MDKFKMRTPDLAEENFRRQGDSSIWPFVGE